MIYSLYGPDTYRSRQKLKEIIENFRQKGGNVLGLEKFDAEEDDSSKIAAADNQSLFQDKKLVVIERFFTSKKVSYELLKMKLKLWQESTVIIFIFWDEDIGLKKEYKEFLKFVQKSQEFKELSPRDAGIFIEKEAISRKLRLSERDKSALLERWQNNSWGIINELDKMELGSDFARGPVLNKEEKIYNFIDALVERRSSAPRLLFSLYESGAEEVYIFASIINSFRNLLLIKKFGGDSKMLEKIQNELGIHPFVFRKLLTQSQKFDLNALAAIYKKLLEYDQSLKLGKTKLEYVVFDLMRI